MDIPFKQTVVRALAWLLLLLMLLSTFLTLDCGPVLGFYILQCETGFTIRVPAAGSG